MSLPDVLREALGQVIANERAAWRHERELIEAQARATIAELRAEVVALRAQVEERLAAVRDGRDGKDGAPGEPGPRGDAGSPGEPGVQGPPGEAGPPGPPPSAQDIAFAVARYLAENPPPAGRDGIDGKDGAPGRDGTDGAPGRDGEPGRDGAPGKLPIVRAWTDGVHYEGDVVSHAGGTWQALRDTGREPPHADWVCLASPGQNGADGRSPNFRGAWSVGEAYRAFDVAMVNGSSFVALRDDPGECPGDGWRLFASGGVKGRPGDRGPAGPPGDRGPPGPAVTRMNVGEEGQIVLLNADGTTVEGDLYPVLSKIAHR